MMSFLTPRVLVAIVVVVALLLLVLGPSFCFTVDERELAVVLQFGQPVREIKDPGLYFKLPLLQEVRRLPKTRQLWVAHPKEALMDLPTADGKKINVQLWAIWRINNPTVFVQVLRDVKNGEDRVTQFVRGVMRDVITKYELSELVRSSSRELKHSQGVDPRTLGVPPEGGAPPGVETAGKIRLGREKILEEIKKEALDRLATDLPGSAAGEHGGRGIELIAVGITKIDFVATVQQAAFDRQIALMQSIASLYVNEGEQMKQEILNRTNAEVQRIEGEGRQKSNTLKGDADAEIIRSYAKAIEEAGEFYTFVRTLEAYKKAFGHDTRIILTTDSEFLQLLKQSRPPPAPPKPPASR